MTNDKALLAAAEVYEKHRAEYLGGVRKYSDNATAIVEHMRAAIEAYNSHTEAGAVERVAMELHDIDQQDYYVECLAGDYPESAKKRPWAGLEEGFKRQYRKKAARIISTSGLEAENRRLREALEERQRVKRDECGFCLKKDSDVQYLVAGPKCYICNECIGLCDGMVCDAATSKLAEAKKREGLLEAALCELFETKHMKDKEGKTPEYESRRVAAWEQAVKALRGEGVDNSKSCNGQFNCETNKRG